MRVVNAKFNEDAAKDLVPLTGSLKISFDKTFNPSLELAQYDVSKYDDDSLYAPVSDDPLNFWDFYKYTDYSSRLMSMEWSRDLKFPYSVSSALADFTVNNTDDFFSPDGGSVIANYVLPKRPLRLLAGYNGDNLQQFIGLTETMPEIDESNKTASFHATDFFTEIFETELDSMIVMENARTDEVLAAIFQSFGLTPEMYSLSNGSNTIPFVFFDKGKNAGNAIKELMQAEGGHLWIDESGVIKFETRIPDAADESYILSDDNVISLKRSGDDGIVNYIKINTEIRKVDSFTQVYSNITNSTDLTASSSDENIVRATSSGIINANLADPCLTIVTPTYGVNSGDSWISATKSDGSLVTTGVSISGVSMAYGQYTIFVTNGNPFDIYVSQVFLWGRPARLANELRFVAKDQNSIDKYGIVPLEGDGITNNFFGSLANARSFAQLILHNYAEFNPMIEATIAGHLALQLGDVVRVTARGIDDTYRITSIKVNFQPWSFTIKASKYALYDFAKYDISVYDGTDAYAP